MHQLEGIDDELKNRLWYIIIDDFFELFDDNFAGNTTDRGAICRFIWKDFFNRIINEIPCYLDVNREPCFVDAKGCILYYKGWFYEDAEWFEIYDFLEFIAELNPRFFSISGIQDRFIKRCNAAFEQELSGYRFVEKKLAMISNTLEFEEVETSIIQTNQFTSLKVVNIHLGEALNKLSDRKNPDYRNSIKESISAVESMVKIISGNPKDSLGGAIDKIKSKIKIHPSLERGFKQIYGYTSDADGIRHGLTEITDCDFEDAKFILVSCSAFINYLIAKSAKAEITFE